MMMMMVLDVLVVIVRVDYGGDDELKMVILIV